MSILLRWVTWIAGFFAQSKTPPTPESFSARHWADLPPYHPRCD